MDVPVNVEVSCTDGACGKSTKVILNPVTERVTHVVVSEREFPHTEFMVPLELLAETSSSSIRLRCTTAELRELDHFVDLEYLPGQESYMNYGINDFMLWPYAGLADPVPPVYLENEHVPPGELAVGRHARVEASDGHVGQVDEFVLERESGHITHLVLRKGHFWGQKDVTIPVGAIDHIDDEAVHLKLDKRAVEALPAVKVQRR